MRVAVAPKENDRQEQAGVKRVKGEHGNRRGCVVRCRQREARHAARALVFELDAEHVVLGQQFARAALERVQSAGV
nr:MAG: hypothetical protein [Molluscum contagiosum virus]